MCLKRGCGFFIAMGGEVVQNHCGAGRNLGDQSFADISSECRAIHYSLNDPGCNEGVIGQACDEGLRTPTAERRIHRQAFVARPRNAQSGEVDFDRCLIKENNTARHWRYHGQAVCEPILASTPFLTLALRRSLSTSYFFYVCSQSALVDGPLQNVEPAAPWHRQVRHAIPTT